MACRARVGGYFDNSYEGLNPFFVFEEGRGRGRNQDSPCNWFCGG